MFLYLQQKTGIKSVVLDTHGGLNNTVLFKSVFQIHRLMPTDYQDNK